LNICKDQDLKISQNTKYHSHLKRLKNPQLNSAFVHLHSTVQQVEQEKVAEVLAQSEEARRQGRWEARRLVCLEGRKFIGFERGSWLTAQGMKRGGLEAGRILQGWGIPIESFLRYVYIKEYKNYRN
jgi:hypothetical protein